MAHDDDDILQGKKKATAPHWSWLSFVNSKVGGMFEQ